MSVCHAAGLIDLANGAGPTVGPFLLCIVVLVIIAAVGGTGHLVLSMCDYSKPLRLVDKGTYLGLIGTLIGMGIMVMSNIFEVLVKFIHLVFG